MTALPRYLVPLATGETLVVTISDDNGVELGIAERACGPLVKASRTEAAQIGHALQYAARDAAQLANRRKR